MNFDAQAQNLSNTTSSMKHQHFCGVQKRKVVVGSDTVE